MSTPDPRVPSQSELDVIVADAVEDTGVTGVAAAVVVGDVTVTSAGGFGNAELARPVTPDTLFQVGSISKTVAASAIMLLVDDGLVDLHDRVSMHLPGIDATTGIDFDSITIEHLLSHQSGFDGDHLVVQRRAAALEDLRGARILFPPGAAYSYSNAGYSVAGEVIARRSGMPFDVFVRTRLLEPLGWRSACYRADDAITADVATPHWAVDGDSFVLRGVGWQPGWELGPLDRAPGGLIASVHHLAQWCRFHQSGLGPDGSRLISAAGLKRLHTPVVTANIRDAIGLDWFVRDIDGATSIGHGGTTVGYVSDLLIVPDAEVAVVGLTNATNGGAAIHMIRRWALERTAGLVEHPPLPDPGAAPLLGEVMGRYLHAFGELTVTEGPRPGTITLTTAARTEGVRWQPPADPPVTLEFVDGRTARTVADGPVGLATFGPAVDSRSTWLNWRERIAPRVSDSREE